MTGHRRTPWPSPWRQPQRADVVELLAVILRGTPALPGAACTAHPSLFDVDADEHQQQGAVELCQNCPALQACRSWADRQPVKQLAGVVAGQRFTGPTVSRNRKKVTV